MCGIVGILSNQPVAHHLMDALRHLEYRGYDSAGIATMENGVLARRRAAGKLKNLEELVEKEPLAGTIGIGHSRWATHGKPSLENAHPHMTQNVAVVHNGIIENYKELRESLLGDGINFESETDTEVIAHLVTKALRGGKPPKQAVSETLKKLRGAFALAFLFDGEEDLIICARQGSPLAIGHGDGSMYLGSDALALTDFTNDVTYLEEGDWAVLHRSGVEIFDRSDKPVQRSQTRVPVEGSVVEKGPFKHFMLKEIHEQQEVISHTLAHYIDLASETIKLPELPFDFAKLSRLSLSACGTAYFAALASRYWFERAARLPVDIDIASEFRYREAPLPKDGMAIFVSQSGETLDTLEALRYCKRERQMCLSIVNTMTSTIAREADVVFPTLAGTEIGVASTKAFTCQLTAMACIALSAGKARGVLNDEECKHLVHALTELPRHISEALELEPQIEQLAKHIINARSVLYVGRGTSFPLALEGALKLKEISYLHAEGYAAGELKHGPIALIDENVPVIVIAPHDDLFEKTLSNMQEVAARGGKVVLITDAKGAELAGDTFALLKMPKLDPFITPIVYAIPIQLLAYYTALHLGRDIDQPRNLAKSVTVE